MLELLCELRAHDWELREAVASSGHLARGRDVGHLSSYRGMFSLTGK